MSIPKECKDCLALGTYACNRSKDCAYWRVANKKLYEKTARVVVKKQKKCRNEKVVR